MDESTRRRFLRAIGIAGASGLAGCSQFGSVGESGGDGADTSASTRTPPATSTPAQNAAGTPEQTPRETSSGTPGTTPSKTSSGTPATTPTEQSAPTPTETTDRTSTAEGNASAPKLEGTETPTRTPAPGPDKLKYTSPNVRLVSYGVVSARDRFPALSRRLETDFKKATDGAVTPTVTGSRHFEVTDHDFDTVAKRFDYMDPDDYKYSNDIPRLWYYYHRNVFDTEVVAKARKASRKWTDVTIVVTDLQFEGKGHYYGTIGDSSKKQGVAVVPSFSIGGWTDYPYYRQETDQALLVDIMMHELGHYYDTGHRAEGRACLMSHGRTGTGQKPPFHFCQKSLERIKKKL